MESERFAKYQLVATTPEVERRLDDLIRLRAKEFLSEWELVELLTSCRLGKSLRWIPLSEAVTRLGLSEDTFVRLFKRSWAEEVNSIGSLVLWSDLPDWQNQVPAMREHRNIIGKRRQTVDWAAWEDFIAGWPIIYPSSSEAGVRWQYLSTGVIDPKANADPVAVYVPRPEVSLETDHLDLSGRLQLDEEVEAVLQDWRQYSTETMPLPEEVVRLDEGEWWLVDRSPEDFAPSFHDCSSDGPLYMWMGELEKGWIVPKGQLEEALLSRR